MPLAPGAVVGPYRVDRFLGQGGVAPVYTASHTVLGGIFAVKVFPTAGMPDLADRTRFQREIASITRLRHPNILAIVDYGHDAEGTYLVGDWMDGGSLDARLGSPVPVEEVVRILGPVAAALDYAHAEGVTHRDVKATNVLFTLDGRPMLADFSLSSLAAASRATTLPTGAGQAMGGMPPEQALGEAIVPQTDVYAFAVVAYQLLAGRFPFRPSAPLDVPPPREVNPDLSPAVEQALLKGLSRRPEDRYPSAGELLAAIEGAAGVEGAGPGVSAGLPGAAVPGSDAPAGMAIAEATPSEPAVPTSPPTPDATVPQASPTQQFVPPVALPKDAEAIAPQADQPTAAVQLPPRAGSPADVGRSAAPTEQATQMVDLREIARSTAESPTPEPSESVASPTVVQQLPPRQESAQPPDTVESPSAPTIFEPLPPPPPVSDQTVPVPSPAPSAATVFMPVAATSVPDTSPTVLEQAPTMAESPSPSSPPPPVFAPTVAVPVDPSPSPQSPAATTPPTVYEVPAPAVPRDDRRAGPPPPAFPWAIAGAVVTVALAIVVVLAWLLYSRRSAGSAVPTAVSSPVVAVAPPTIAPAVPATATAAPVAAAPTPTVPAPAANPTAPPAAAAPTVVPTPRATAAPAFVPARLVATMGAGQSFCGAVADDDGGQVFVSDSDRGQLVAFDPATRRQSKVYDLKEWLCGIALDQKRGAVWAPVYHRQASGAFDTSRLASVDLASSAVKYFAGSHFPLTPFLDTGTGTLYAGNSADPSLLVVNVQTGQDVDAVPVSSQVNRLAASPVNGHLYMAAVETNMFLVFDPAARKVVTEVRIGKQPWGVAAEPLGGTILVSAEGSDHAALVDPRTNQVIRTYQTGSHPHDVACGGPDRHCFVLNSADRTITTIDTTSDRTVTSAMLPGEDPLTAMAVAPKTGRVFVVSKRQVFVLDEAT